MSMQELGEVNIAIATANMREMAMLGPARADTTENMLRRRQLGIHTADLLHGTVITVVDLSADDAPPEHRPIYAHDTFNEGMIQTDRERKWFNENLRTYDGSTKRWKPREAFFRYRTELTGMVLGVDTKTASLVMSGGRLNRRLPESLQTRWWVKCADNEGSPLVELRMPDKQL